MNAHTVVFDLDGTLVDSRPGILACFRHAFDALNTPCPPDDVLEASIGRPFRSAWGNLLNTTDERRVEQAVGHYRERYGTTGLYEATVYPGVFELLASLESRPVYIVTLKATPYAQRVVEHFSLAQHFRAVHGPSVAGLPDNKTELLAQLLARERITGPAVMIGDRADDILAAKACRMHAIGVLWGYGSESELTEAGADVLCASPADLGGCL